MQRTLNNPLPSYVFILLLLLPGRNRDVSAMFIKTSMTLDLGFRGIIFFISKFIFCPMA